MSQHAEERVITDLSVCRPGARLSREMRQGKWRLIDYTTDDISGTLVWASNDGYPEPVTLPLNVEGWYAIHLGVPKKICFGDPLVKLTDDPCFFPVTKDPYPTWGPVPKMWEGFWKCADLTGQDLVITHGPDPTHRHPTLAYVRLVPLSDAQVTELKEDARDPSFKKLIAIHDGFGTLSDEGADTRALVLQNIEPLRDTDFGMLLVGLLTPLGVTNYKSGHVEMIGDDQELMPSSEARDFVSAHRRLVAQGQDYLDIVLERTKDMGIKTVVTTRMGNIVEAPFDRHWTAAFAVEHPEYWCRDRDGCTVGHLSFVHEQVRAAMATTWREVLHRGADGIGIFFVRSGPMVLYEEPVIKEFTKRHGVDPRCVEENDPRYIDFKVEVVTTCIREMRAVLDEEAARRRSERLALVVEAHGNEENNLFWGIDIAGWAREGLIDVVIAQDHFNYPDSCELEDIDGEAEPDYEFYRRAVQGTNVKLYHDLLPRVMPPNRYRARARGAYENGCHGLAFWDTQCCMPLNQWEVIRRLGHPDELEKSSEVNYRPLRSVNGVRLDRYGTWFSF